MSNTIETEIVIEEEQTTPTESISDLVAMYNSTKKSDTAASAKLTDGFTLKGMDEVKEMVASAMLQIEDLANKGKEQSLAGGLTSKALALVDSDNKWVGKWFGNKQEALRTEAAEQSTISEIVTSLRTNIEAKREEVIVLIEETANIRETMISSINVYKDINSKVDHIVANAAANTRELFDAQQLATRTRSTIATMETDIKSIIEPLLAGASISVQEIQGLLPTIENDLQSKLAIKAFQQQLQDLHEMTKAVSDLSISAGDKIRSSVNDTIYESIEILGESGVDVARLEKSLDDEKKHQAKVAQITRKVSDKINTNYNKMTALTAKITEGRDEDMSNLLASYATGAK